MPEPSAKVAALEAKRRQIDARLQVLKNREKAKERKLDTRRKVLLGALLIEMMKEDPALRQRIGARLKKFLVRKIDREAFGV